MVQTGAITIPYWLTILALLLPLIPAFIIFFRRAFDQESLNYLVILCLLLFIEQVVLRIPQFSSIDPAKVQPAFRLGEFIVLFWLYRSTMQHNWLKELLSYFLVGFASVVITIFVNRGIDAYAVNIDMAESITLVFLSILVLLQLIRIQYIFIFQNPLFWIAGGSLSYYLMAVIIEVMSGNKIITWQDNGTEKEALLLGFSIVRLIFYIIAASIKKQRTDEVWMIYSNQRD